MNNIEEHFQQQDPLTDWGRVAGGITVNSIKGLKVLNKKVIQPGMEKTWETINEHPKKAARIAVAAIGLVALEEYRRNSCYWSPENLNCHYDLPEVEKLVDENPEKAFFHLDQCSEKEWGWCEKYTKENLEKMSLKDESKYFNAFTSCNLKDSIFCETLASRGFPALIKNGIFKAQGIAQDCLKKKTNFCDAIFSIAKDNFDSSTLAILSKNCDVNVKLSCHALKA